MHLKFDCKLIYLVILLFFQVLIVLFYLKFSSSWNLQENGEKLPKPMRYVGFDQLNRVELEKYKSYYNSEVDEEIYLKTEKVDVYFTMINDTVCFQQGTDIRYMKRNIIEADINKCECLPGYHGNDCSLPEIIWRAFIALRQNTIITKRKKHIRRLIQVFHIAHPAQIQHAVIQISELVDTIDLFVISESNQTDTGDYKDFYFMDKLNKGLLKDYHYKILYVPIYKNKNNLSVPFQSYQDLAIEKTNKIVKNLNDDDLILNFNDNEIPNPKSLLFFKLFDGFSLPVTFRLKWNVFGYFYQHPLKTKTKVSGYTTQMLKRGLHNHVSMFTIGDLNHYGGWLCDLCFNPNELLNVIQSLNYEKVLSENSNRIDVTYIEELIGDGKYIDGKTELVKNSQNNAYYGPQFVLNNTWKYDSLLINYYNKIDYN